MPVTEVTREQFPKMELVEKAGETAQSTVVYHDVFKKPASNEKLAVEEKDDCPMSTVKMLH